MAALFAMSSLVNAGIVELILGEEYEAVATASSSSEHTCTVEVGAMNTTWTCPHGGIIIVMKLVAQNVAG